MKKTILLVAAMLLAFAQGAWAADYDPCPSPYDGFCYWPGDGCYQINTGTPDTPSRCPTEHEGCVKDGYLYKEVKYPTGKWGEGSTCKELGGVWAEVGNDPNFNGGVFIWCKWATSCQSVKTDEEKANCIKNGSVFKTVPSTGIGNGTTCQGGTWTEEGRDPNAVMIGCCDWDNKGCFAVYETTEWNKCKSAERYTTCPNDEAGTCRAADKWPSSSSIAVSSSSSSSERKYAFCIFEGFGCLSGSFGSDCVTSGGVPSDTCPSSSSGASSSSSSTSDVDSSSSSDDGSTDGDSSSSEGDADSSSSSDGEPQKEYAYCIFAATSSCLAGPFLSCPPNIAELSDECPYPSYSPILSHYRVHSNALTAMHNAVNLQSAGNAIIQVFNLKGKVVRTLRFSQGSYMVSLSGLPKGLYIVKASNASWKQTIKVAVK
jgi:hypothetical protein